jgi:large subunit ribosomal protein L18
MSAKRYEYSAKIRRTRRVRARVKAAGHLRLSVFRSARHIYAQVVDDAAAKTLVSASSLDAAFKEQAGKGKKSKKSVTGANKGMAEVVGKILGERAIAAGITEVSFDRGGYPYHGRVRSLAEGARAAGLKF